MPKNDLIITTPKGAVCGLYPGIPAYTNYFKAIDPEKAILATRITEDGQKAVYHYEHLDEGLYHCGVSMDGYYALCQMLHHTAEKNLSLDIKLDKLAGNGYEAGYVMRCTQEYIDRQMVSHKDAWGAAYADLFQTPQFLRKDGYSRHQQTTNEELADFIVKLAKTNGNMYVFSLGKSPKYGYDMPLVLFTKENITGMSLADAARLIRNNKKPTIQYAAQCHSTEPASCEGALAMMIKLCGDYGNRVLDSLDIYIIPRINPDGAYDVMRHSPTTNEDMNRDYLRVHNQEIRMVIGAYNLFFPEIAIDGHEKMNCMRSEGNSLCTDMELQVGAGSLNHPAVMTELAMKMALTALDNGRKLGLRGHFYSRLASAAGGCAGSSYFGTRNSLSFLVETPGQVAAGMEFLERRILGHYVLASTVIDYAVENAQKIMDTVHASRKKMQTKGGLYSEDDLMVLEHENIQTGIWNTPLIHAPTGTIVDSDHPEAYTEQNRFTHARPRATAYVLPRGLATEAQILQTAEIHAIPYYPLPAGSQVNLQQYLEIDGKTQLAPAQAVCFDEGAYVFPNNLPSTILNVIMEPDFNRSSGRKMTLYSMGLIKADASGNLPLFRYCHDLSDGKVHTE